MDKEDKRKVRNLLESMTPQGLRLVAVLFEIIEELNKKIERLEKELEKCEKNQS